MDSVEWDIQSWNIAPIAKIMVRLRHARKRNDELKGSPTNLEKFPLSKTFLHPPPLVL